MSNFKDVRPHNVARGTLSVKVKHRTLGVIDSFGEENLVVQMSNNILAGLMGGDLGKIDRISLGNSPTAATLSDITISDIDTSTLELGNTRDVDNNMIAFTKQMVSHEYPTLNSVQFNWEVGYNEANGIGITEYGLCNEQGYMFSRKVRGLIEKTEDLALEGTWTIEFLEIPETPPIPVI